MKTRRFDEPDHDALRAIYRESRVRAFDWLDTASLRLEDFDRDTAGESIWVAEDSTSLLGFVSIWAADDFIHHLYVRPGSSGRGVGSALLAACLAHMNRPASLKCVTRNIAAREFYLARSWRVVSEGDGPEGPYLLMHFDEAHSLA